MSEGESPRLYRQWRVVTVTLAAALAGGAITLDAWSALPRLPGLVDSVGVQWGVPAAVAGGFVVWFCRRHLDANRRDATEDVCD